MKIKILASIVLITSSLAIAQANTIQSLNAGWINASGTSNNTGFNSTSNNNIFTGYQTQQYNDWFTFTIGAAQTGQQIVSATLYVYNDARNGTTDPNATLSFYQANANTFGGLVGGTLLYQSLLSIVPANNAFDAFILNSDTLSLLNAAAGSNFTIGGSVFSSVGNGTNFVIDAFGYTNGSPNAYLDITYGNTVPEPGNAVPEPASIALLTLGIFGFGASRRKKNQA